jgi:Cof subfamily protein (haloacid dehalogenase superfamily)
MFLEGKCKVGGINAVVATDFDGTLLRSDHTVSDRSRDTLEMLGDKNILRVIATGRSYYSLKKVLEADLPIDYLIVASGAGIYCNKSKQLIYQTNLSREETEFIGNKLLTLGCDFMVHHPLPDNHKFHFYKHSSNNIDYKKRFEIYKEHAFPLEELSDLPDTSSQFLIVDPPGANTYDKITSLLSGFTIIKTTSPLDFDSTWIEIFPLHTDKGKTLKILTKSYNLGAGDVLSVGNDFNDVHMLRWTGESRIVANAHNDLRNEFINVSSNDKEGFSEAVEDWLRGRF